MNILGKDPDSLKGTTGISPQHVLSEDVDRGLTCGGGNFAEAGTF